MQYIKIQNNLQLFAVLYGYKLFKTIMILTFTKLDLVKKNVGFEMYKY
jgi:hypothetical protein